MADVDEALAATAMGLNEDAKAARKAKASKPKHGEPMKNAPDVELPPPGVEPPVEGSSEKVDLSEKGHETAIERMETAASEFPIGVASAIPDVRDFLLDQIKHRPKLWAQTSNAEQHDVAGACEHAATELVRKVVEVVAAAGKAEPIRCLFVGYSDKGDDIKLDLKLKTVGAEETGRAVLALHQAKGKFVLLAVASADDFRTEDRDPTLDDDQPPLDFEASTAGPEHPADDSDLAGEEEAPIVRTGDVVPIDGHGDCEIEVNLVTQMVEATPLNGDPLAKVDVREATSAELAAERERKADFGD